MELNGINPELYDMVRRGLLSSKKCELLVYIRQFVDRLAATRYVEAEEVDRLVQKFGVSPDILSWGDYFQTEIASRHFELSDDEFHRIIETVRFDLISSIMIFQGKPESFIEEAELQSLEEPFENEVLDEAQEEMVHLSILARYFRELGLKDSDLSEEDEIWFRSFVDASNRSAG